MGRHAAGHGRLGDGVPAGVPRADFDQVVVSMKSSNTRVMVAAYRPAGRGDGCRGYALSDSSGRYRGRERHRGAREERRGHRALLADGIGDTIRVSLTEAPENEIPVAQLLVDHFAERPGAIRGPASRTLLPDRIPPPFEGDGSRRAHRAAGGFPGARSPFGQPDGRVARRDPESRHPPTNRWS